jgi:AcrR family transcriptional regulator
VAERRRRFLEAGFELFGTRGFADVRIRDLCAAADLTDRYFYESFKNMEELFDVIVADLAAEVHRVSFEAMNKQLTARPTDLRAWVRGALASGMEFMASDPRRIRIAFLETVRVQSHADYHRTFTAMAEEDLIQMIPNLTGTKSLNSDEARMRSVACIAAGNELVVAWAEGRLKANLATIIDFITDLWLSAMSLPNYEVPRGRSRGPRQSARQM